MFLSRNKLLATRTEAYVRNLVKGMYSFKADGKTYYCKEFKIDREAIMRKLLQYKIENDISSRDMADKLNMSLATFGVLSNGDRRMTPYHVWLISKVVKIPDGCGLTEESEKIIQAIKKDNVPWSNN
ncbi:MAG: hypothetical protein J7J57_01105 [Caldisericaceae bacterium]|nr:hypothetical protein [Caldisericaceae bacterium]